MSRCSQLKQEAAQLRGQMEHRTILVHQSINSLLQQLRTLARCPATLLLVFVCGMVAEQLRVPGIKRVYGLMARLLLQ
ncbi:hypothetical protein SAMN02745752_00004 [Marinospirillum alkaliphilum DSM 21637]|uniref:Uncharacterized protein n=1 Tax=Marinospirillum alkaliphilum DSM 21637 TaxID=1122209 RepID=A0A1K1TAD4_9GAMM|nr:hypothetical protein SAMN02745752_00004 [Marinospirillum alkaliphilum DSM 21637]